MQKKKINLSELNIKKSVEWSIQKETFLEEPHVSL